MRIAVQHLCGTPSRALVLTDTPDPQCLRCDGYGWITHDYDGTEFESCHCWIPTHRLILLPLPYLPRPWSRRQHADVWDPPF